MGCSKLLRIHSHEDLFAADASGYGTSLELWHKPWSCGTRHGAVAQAIEQRHKPSSCGISHGAHRSWPIELTSTPIELTSTPSPGMIGVSCSSCLDLVSADPNSNSCMSLWLLTACLPSCTRSWQMRASFLMRYIFREQDDAPWQETA